MLANATQNMSHVMHIIIFWGYNLDISGLAAELRFFWGAAVVANVGPIVQKGAGNQRHRPVWSSTRVVLGQRTGGGAMGG